ncbi:MAG: hypothetical protein HPY69_14290 [Armatimonadetes bacterium]|nr:hypothetical protein [Armatimonadota bacterium]
MDELEAEDWYPPPEFLDLLHEARRRVTAVGTVATVFGLLGLGYMLALAALGLSGTITLVKVGFLGAHAVGMGIGLGLLNQSGGARAAGSVWFLAWGIANLIVGFAALYAEDPLLGLFTFITGAVHCLFSAMLASPEIVFLCEYVGSEITEQRAHRGLQAALLGGTPEMQLFATSVIRPLPPAAAPPEDD